MKNTRFRQPHSSQGRFPLRGKHIAVFVLALLIAAATPLWIQGNLLALTTPLWKARSVLAQGVVSARERLMSRDDLETENRRLREENARLAFRGALYDELRGEVKRLEGLLGRVPESDRFVLARVLASPSASPYDSFLIDVGSAEGIQEGNRVIFDETIALGVIDLVSPQSARVSLFSAPDMTHEVYVGTTSARLEAVGRGGGMFLIKAPKDLTIGPSDAIMAAGSNEAIAFVRSVESRDSDAFQTVYAVMPVNLFETREVLVLPHN